MHFGVIIASHNVDVTADDMFLLLGMVFAGERTIGRPMLFAAGKLQTA